MQAIPVKMLDGERQVIYKLTPPYEDNEYVCVSTALFPNLIGHKETMIFASDADSITSFTDLVCVWTLSHRAALAELGYQISVALS